MIIELYSLVLSLVLPAPHPMVGVHRLAQKDLRASVLIHTIGVKPGQAKRLEYGCSGTFINPNTILTAAHCFDGYDVQKVWVRGPQDTLGYRAHVDKIDYAFDLATLTVGGKHAYAKVGPAPEVGDEVINVGSPLMFEFTVSDGVVSALRFHYRGLGGHFIVTTAMINHGSSGGGAFNKNGRLIGVNTRSIGLFGWEGISLAVDVETIRRFLDD